MVLTTVHGKFTDFSGILELEDNDLSKFSWQAVDMPTTPLASCDFLAAQRDPTLTAAGRGQGPGWRIFQPTTQPTKDDVLYDLQVFWQSPRCCKSL
jgi:hypothetical protein